MEEEIITQFIDMDTAGILAVISVAMYRFINWIKDPFNKGEASLMIVASGFTYWYATSIGDLRIGTLAIIFTTLIEGARGVYNFNKKINESNT